MDQHHSMLIQKHKELLNSVSNLSFLLSAGQDPSLTKFRQANEREKFPRTVPPHYLSATTF